MMIENPFVPREASDVLQKKAEAYVRQALDSKTELYSFEQNCGELELLSLANQFIFALSDGSTAIIVPKALPAPSSTPLINHAWLDISCILPIHSAWAGPIQWDFFNTDWESEADILLGLTSLGFTWSAELQQKMAPNLRDKTEFFERGKEEVGLMVLVTETTDKKVRPKSEGKRGI